jgi:malonyl CoA-acyl carrier protein transacylase
MSVFMFPGQGSQQRGMGKGLFDEVPEFTRVEAEVDRVLGYSVRELCLTDSMNRLRDTRFTQPSLYVTNALYYFRAKARGERAHFVVGHSLGEYNALLAAGAFDFLTGLRMVQKRGELMAQARNGSMAAIIGLPAARIREVLRQAALTGTDVANFNSPSQTVISGPVAEIQKAQAVFEGAGAQMFVTLPVSAAFHSRYMIDAAEAFGSFLQPFTFSGLQVPVISNVTATAYPTADVDRAIKTLLVKQISSSVEWAASIRYLIAQGATSFMELGPGSVLTRLVQQIQQASGAGQQPGDSSQGIVRPAATVSS